MCISNDKAELHEKIVSVIFLEFKHYPCTCCLMQGRCFNCFILTTFNPLIITLITILPFFF